LEEQAKATDQVAQEAQNLTQQIAVVTKAMAEQSKAASEVATSVRVMRRQSDQVTKGIAEQARAAREMTTAIASIAKEVSTITRSNRQHLESSAKVVIGIREMQQVASENAANGNLLTTNSDALTERIQRLAESMDRKESGNRSNGSAIPTTRKKARKAAVSEGT
jgi:methyl-accepting chemotaxis protein